MAAAGGGARWGGENENENEDDAAPPPLMGKAWDLVDVLCRGNYWRWVPLPPLQIRRRRGEETGATRTTATSVTKATTTAATAARMMLNGDKHNNQILSQHQRQGKWW